MGKYKNMGIYDTFIGIFRKKLSAEETQNPHSTNSLMPVFLLPCLASKLQLVLGSLLQPYTTALVIVKP